MSAPTLPPVTPPIRTPRPLHGEQRLAVDPREVVWLRASAGTGKTHVLTSRVLRLLLEPGMSPERILCLTFTKAGATEMAARINRELAEWVRLPATSLQERLAEIGADFSPQSRERARSLFAAVLDCPGGGLRIETIHAFSQWLLAAFPAEAGMQPGFRPMEDRDRQLLQREVLAEMLTDAEARGDMALLDCVAMLSLRLGRPGEVEGFLAGCAKLPQLWEGAMAVAGPLRPHLNLALGLAADEDGSGAAALLADGAFDRASLEECAKILAEKGADKAKGTAGAIVAWLGLSASGRLEKIGDLQSALLTKDGKPRRWNKLHELHGFDDVYARSVAVLGAASDLQTLANLTEWLAPAFALGRDFSMRWAQAKEREGYIDFDDQIRLAAQLLGTSDMADWIRFKLDRQFDHVLVDEAQDTNAAQWDIVYALIEEFFAGQGVGPERLRTLFVVGDYKQAIFGFQGTSPENFEAARVQIAQWVEGVQRKFNELGLAQSFRTAQPVLDFVDKTLESIGSDAIGLPRPPDLHRGADRPGQVVLWHAATRNAALSPDGTAQDGDADDEDFQADEDAGGEGGEDGKPSESWLSKPNRAVADQIAQQVSQWLADGFPLTKGNAPGAPPRAAGPGDILILVRKRKELAGLIVARLHAAGVPVAGVDRLRLGAPLAVRDILAALRFASQPLDSLSLASLLVSPLFGWSQEQLLEHGFRPDKLPLWEHLQATRHPDVDAAVTRLLPLLARSDYEPPHRLIEWLLAGPWQGRAKLTARLGQEANDPLDELINAATAFALSNTPSIDGFLQWFDASTDDLKRESDGARGLVRVMTAHGSKGLEAPIVILADAADDPGKSPDRGLSLPLASRNGGDGTAGIAFPLPRLNKEHKRGILGEIAARAKLAEREEHWRLLYVAMTRAEEALFITGATNHKEGKIPEDSWYAAAERVMIGAGCEWQADPLWGSLRRFGVMPPAAKRADAQAPGRPALAEPAWLRNVVGPEPRPPRPLSPSSLGPDDVSDPPVIDPAVLLAAARRGVLLHRLLERLPDVARAARSNAAARWLAREAQELSTAERDALQASTLAVLDHPDFADFFAAGSLAEVPIAAQVEGQVIVGTVDRLVITPDHIRIVDFKSARRPPKRLEDVPTAYLRQMAAYARALAVIYPGRVVEAALLYTQTPQMFLLGADLLAKQTINLPQETSPDTGPETGPETGALA